MFTSFVPMLPSVLSRVKLVIPALLLAAAFPFSAACTEVQVPARLLELLNAPDHTEIHYKLEVDKPVLMFQQQYLLRVHGEFSRKTIEHREIQHLQVLTKVRDDSGRWLEGEDFDEFTVPVHLQGKALFYSCAIYLRPGRYRVGVVMLDTETNRANVYHRDIVIEPMKNDPFPAIDAALPEVEFPERANNGPRGFWHVGDRIRPIPVTPPKHTRLDLVLSITKRFRWDILYRMDVQTMLQSGSVLGHLRPADGCVRVSVIDPLRLRVLLDRYPADKLSWAKLQDAIEKVDQNVIDVKVLANQQKVAAFTHDYLQQVAADRKVCGDDSNPVTPMVVVVSPDLVLPDGNRLSNLAPLEGNCYFYLHVGYGGGWMDGMGQILSSAKPQKVSCTNPRDFRGAMAKIASGTGPLRE